VTPIDKLREALDGIDNGMGYQDPAAIWESMKQARAALDELAKEHSGLLTERDALRDTLNGAVETGNDRIRDLEAQLSAQPKALGRLHCRECNYHPSEPINCSHCGANWCMTREPLETRGNTDG